MRFLILFAVIGGIVAQQQSSRSASPSSNRNKSSPVTFMTLDPGHFHAALVQKEMYPGVSSQVYVYAPLGQDLVDHMARVARYNNRQDNPTNWELIVKTGPDFLEQMLNERPGNVVVISGRNRGKIDLINASLKTGLNVLADKPWILTADELPKLDAALKTADQRGLIAYDIMTERYEITTILQKEIINDVSVFGQIEQGTEQNPGVYIESVHQLMKVVSGVPNLRPVWFFDIEQQGEGMNDVGSHLVDLVPWILFPEQPIDYRRDVQMLNAKRWPTVIGRTDFQKVTNEPQFPAFLMSNVHDDKLSLFGNTEAEYRLKGVHVRLRTLWNYTPPPGASDTHYAVFRGTRARVEVRQEQEKNLQTELYIIPKEASSRAEVLAALQKKIESLQTKYPGLSVENLGAEFRVNVPLKYRDGHEAHFASVTKLFLSYLANPKSLPAWERANMLAKYYVTTKSIELSKSSGAH